MQLLKGKELKEEQRRKENTAITAVHEPTAGTQTQFVCLFICLSDGDCRPQMTTVSHDVGQNKMPTAR